MRSLKALRAAEAVCTRCPLICGRMIDLADGGRMVATIHPSYILRIDDEATNERNTVPS